MQRDNGTPSACASCRYQRKKCTENCILASYFPLEKNKEFLAVHKLFGVSNVTKIVKSLDVEDRQRAVDSLVWEATCRQNNPILGSYAEFIRVSEELDKYKTHFRNNFYTPDLMSMNMNMNGNTSIALVPAISYPGYSYQTLQSTDILRDGISYNYPHALDTKNLKEEISNDSAVILPQQYEGHDVENLKNESSNGSANLPLHYSMGGINQPYFGQLPAGEYGPSTEAKPQPRVSEF